tara:strand:+ start:1698 stop:2744 length:1047 start_codon:yes stop_codon:yes gene_type:complete
MNNSQFTDIFLSPLFKEKIKLDEIDKEIHDEIIDLSNWFCMPKQILNNLIYEKECTYNVIERLKKQITVSNLKNLINQKEIIKIADIFNKHGIKYVFLKGSAINLMDGQYVRYSRDIDVIVEKSFLSKAYQLLKKLGYTYRNSFTADDSKYIKNTNHLPILTNKEGSFVEIHHRITQSFFYDKCPLAASMLKNFTLVKKNNVDIRISDLNHLISHITYHAVLHHRFELGPVFLYDIKYLKSLIDNEKDLINLLTRTGLEKDYKKIIGYIENKNKTDIFDIYESVKFKKNIGKFKYLFFNRDGKFDFFNINIKKLKRIEDDYQTSKYSVKFYFFLLIEFKNLCLRILKT